MNLAVTRFGQVGLASCRIVAPNLVTLATPIIIIRSHLTTLNQTEDTTARKSTSTACDFVINRPLTRLSIQGTDRPAGVGTGRRPVSGETCPAVGGACPRPQGGSALHTQL